MPLHVGVDLAPVGAQLGRERDRRGVRAAAAEGRDLGGVDVARGGGVVEAVERRDAHPLEARDDDDLAAADLGPDPAGVDARDARLAVAPVRRDARLGTGEAERRDAHRVERHRHQGGALVLAGGQQDVELPRVRIVRDPGREGEQLVGRVTHRGHDDDEVTPVRALAGDPAGDPLDPLRSCDRRPAELHDDERVGHAAHSTGGPLSPPLRRVRDNRLVPRR
jgi:hypothetical protein